MSQTPNTPADIFSSRGCIKISSLPLWQTHLPTSSCPGPWATHITLQEEWGIYAGRYQNALSIIVLWYKSPSLSVVSYRCDILSSDLSLPMRTRCSTPTHSRSSEKIEHLVIGPYFSFVRYHHYVQQQIKKRRRGKKVKIQFPKDLLKSGKYQNMLHNKVGSQIKRKSQNRSLPSDLWSW